MLDNAYKFPDRTSIAETLEPIINAKIFVRNEYIGKIMELCHYSRGEYIDSEIFDENNTILNFYLPLGRNYIFLLWSIKILIARICFYGIFNIRL